MDNSTKLAIVLLAVLAALLLLLPKASEPQTAGVALPSPSPTLSLSPNQFRENQLAELRLTMSPSCTYSEGQLFVDGQTINNAKADGSTITASLRLMAGRHVFSYDDGACNAELKTTVLPAACVDGSKRSCSNTISCVGTQECRAGEWTACRAPDPICAPNVQVPCPLDSCNWGMTTCNSCGSGWSICK